MSAGAWVQSVKRNGPLRPVPIWVWGMALALAALAGLSVASPLFAVVFLGGAGLIALVRHIFLRPHDGFVYALAVFPFYPFLRGAATAYHVPLPLAVVGMWPEVLLCVIMTSVLCQRIRLRQKLRVSRDDVPVVLLLFSTLYGVVLSILEKDAVAVVYGFHQSVTAYLFFFVARWISPPPGYVPRLVRTWLISFCLLAIFSFADYALRPEFVIKILMVLRPELHGPFDPHDFWKWYPRMQSLLFGEQFWGTVCVFVALYSLIALFEKGRRLSNRLGLWTSYLLSLAGLLCSMSRGAFVCFAVSLAALLCFRGPHRRALLITSLAVCVTSAMLIANFSDDLRVASLTKRTVTLLGVASGGSGMAYQANGTVDQASSATNRVAQWQHAIESFPLFPAGRGLGRAGAAAFFHNTSVNVNDVVSDGGYFRILAETGLPGVVCFFVGMAGVMGVLLRLLRDRAHVRSEDRALTLTIFSFFAGLLAQQLGGDAFGFFYIIPFAWLSIGLLLSRRENQAAVAALPAPLITKKTP